MLDFENIVHLCYFPEILQRCGLKDLLNDHDYRYTEFFKSVTKDLHEKELPYMYTCGKGFLPKIDNQVHSRCLQIYHRVTVRGVVNTQRLVAMELSEWNYLSICLVDTIRSWWYNYVIKNNMLWIRTSPHIDNTMHDRFNNRFNDEIYYNQKLRRVRSDYINPLDVTDPLYIQYVKPLVDNYVEHDKLDNINNFKRV